MNDAFCRHELRRPKAKGSGDELSPEPAPLARRRPGYSSSGCTPAEPDSASPGACSLGQLGCTSKTDRNNSLLEIVARHAGSNGEPA